MRTHVRSRSLVLLLALVGVQLMTLGGAFAGDPACLCDENMCTHHPKGHGSHDHGSGRNGHQGHRSDGHGSHGAAEPASPPPAAATESAAASTGDHCAYQAAVVDTGNCTMRGCDHRSEDSLPVTSLASLSDPTSVARPEGVTALASAAIASPLDRSSRVEPPPPRHLSV